jgi:hypothetical protein
VNGEIDRVQKSQGDWAADEMRERAQNYDGEHGSDGLCLLFIKGRGVLAVALTEFRGDQRAHGFVGFPILYRQVSF